MLLLKRWLKITDRFEGIHYYPDAPDDVAFLRHPHRHLFYVTLWVEVFHDNRELEFFQVQRWLREQFSHTTVASCEQMAEEILRRAQGRYPARRLKAEVSEDNENSAFVETVEDGWRQNG